MWSNAEVQLHLTPELAARYHSPAQIARVLSEAWATANLYCPCCPQDSLDCCANNREAIDFTCGGCESVFQLKSSKTSFGKRVTDGAYNAMARAINAGTTPNLVMMRYDSSRWTVSELEFIPSFAFTLSSIERRRPLSKDAERHDWVGCNIVISNVPADLRIKLIHSGEVLRSHEVRERYKTVTVLRRLPVEQRGWTLDVLNVVRSIGKARFNLAEVYANEGKLSQLHPLNHHVRDKIRQQLQVLRNMGFLEFLGNGEYKTGTLSNG